MAIKFTIILLNGLFLCTLLGCGEKIENLPHSEVVFTAEMVSPYVLSSGGIMVYVQKTGSLERVAGGIVNESQNLSLSLPIGSYRFYAVAIAEDSIDGGMDAYCGTGVGPGGGINIDLLGEGESVGVNFNLSRNNCYAQPFFGDSSWFDGSGIVGDMFLVACGGSEFSYISSFYGSCSYFSGYGSFKIELDLPSTTMQDFSMSGGGYTPSVCFASYDGSLGQHLFLPAGSVGNFIVPFTMTYFDGSQDCSTGGQTSWSMTPTLDVLTQTGVNRGKLYFDSSQAPKLFFRAYSL